MAAAPSDDDATTCPICHVTLSSGTDLQLHYLQDCAGYDNEMAGDPMSTKPAGLPHAMQQNFGGGGSHNSGFDRQVPSSRDHGRAAVGGGEGNFSGLSQHLVRFVWYPNDPFKIQVPKATLLSSFTAGEGSVELFKDKDAELGSYSSSTVAVRIGKFESGQIVVGEEMLEVEPYEVSTDCEEVYLITQEKDQPGPPPVNPPQGNQAVSVPTHASDPYHAMNQFSASSRPHPYGGDRTTVTGAGMAGHQDFQQYGRSSPSSSQDTLAAMQPHVKQDFGNYSSQQLDRRPAASQPFDHHISPPMSSPPYTPPSQYSSPGITQHQPGAGDSSHISTIEAMKRSSGLGSSGRHSDEMVVRAPTSTVAQEYYSPNFVSGSPRQVVLSNTSPSDLRPSASVQPNVGASPYGTHGNDGLFMAGKPDQDFSGSTSGGGANLMVNREKEFNLASSQKPGINLQNLSGMEDTAAQHRARELEERLLRTEQERDETKRSMERSNTMLNSRIRRLEDQLNVTSQSGGSREVALLDEIKKLNVRINELESTEHLMKESTTNQAEVERHYQQQLQELEQKNAEQKEHISNLEAICAMQQGESLEESKKEIEQNKGVIAQLQSQVQKNELQYQQLASNLEDAHQKQTDLLEESRAAMTRSMELTEENAKLHEQNFNLTEDFKSLKTKLQEQGGGGGFLNDEELKTEVAKLKKELQIQAENAEREQQMLEQKNYTIAAELQRLRDLNDSGSGLGGSAEVQSLKAEITKLNDTIQTLQMQQTSYQSTHQQMEQEISATEQQNNSLQEQVVAMQSSQRELLQRISTTVQEKAVLSEQLKQLQQSPGGAVIPDSEVSSLRDQLHQISKERDDINRQLNSTEHYKNLLESENAAQKVEISKLLTQAAAEKDPGTDDDSVMLQVKLQSAEEIMKKATEESAAKDATINELHTRMLALQETRGQLENEVAAMREQKEKMLVENSQLREVATQPTKYQHAVEENKQLKRDNQELGNALEKAQTELQIFKENSAALQEQLVKATDPAKLNAITDKMSKYKGKRDDARAQVQALQEQLHMQGGGGSGDLSKMSRYREERNALQAEVTKLNTIIAQMASSQAAKPLVSGFDRQISEEDPQPLTGSYECPPTSDLPATQSALQSSSKHADKGSAPSQATSKTHQKTPPQTKHLPATGSASKLPTAKRSAKSVIKKVTTRKGEENVWCEPISVIHDLKEGQRVVVSRIAGNEFGMVKIINATIDKKKGYIGVELDLSSGSSDGEVKGRRYFTCAPNHAAFVLLKSVFKIVQ